MLHTSSYSPSRTRLGYVWVYSLSHCGVSETQSQHLRFNGGGVGAGPEGAAFTSSLLQDVGSVIVHRVR